MSALDQLAETSKNLLHRRGRPHMGTTASPWRYDGIPNSALECANPIQSQRWFCDGRARDPEAPPHPSNREDYFVGFEFRCQTCGEIHKGMPGFGADAPLSYYAIPEAERASRCELGSDDCVIDRASFFVRGCLEIPVHGADEPLIWGVWADLSEESFIAWLKVFEEEHRSHVGPFFGWLNAWLKPYPETINLKTRVHLRDHGLWPWIELEPTDHPLAQEQRNGISVDRVAEIYAMMMHGRDH